METNMTSMQNNVLSKCSFPLLLTFNPLFFSHSPVDAMSDRIEQLETSMSNMMEIAGVDKTEVERQIQVSSSSLLYSLATS